MLDLTDSFLQLPTAKRYWIAFSGGLDSTVLLHLAKNLLNNKPLTAIHINHGLQSGADDWEKHCARMSKQWGVSYKSDRVAVDLDKGESPEAAARDARYAAIIKHLNEGDCLLTAHHRDDQAETVLLQLIRGSGPKGLAAMPLLKRKANYWHARPLLNISRAQLEKYARQEKLKWIEDVSNQDTDFNRNFLRQEVIPLLKTRWPSLDATLYRAAEHQADAAKLLEQFAMQDIQQWGSEIEGVLSIQALLKLSVPRQSNVLRLWLSLHKAAMPSQARLDEILKMLNAAPDRNPRVQWSQTEIRRYRNALHCLPLQQEHDANSYYDWNIRTPIVIAAIGITLTCDDLLENGIALPTSVERLQIRFRQGGEKIKLQGKAHTSSVKNLLQETGVPPWLRDRLPMLYLDDELVAILCLKTALVAEKYFR